MKVCHLTSVHPYLDIRIFMKECKTLSEHGYEVHLVAPDAPDEILEGVYVHNVIKINGSRIRRMTKTVWSVYRKAKVINADIYHFHDPELMIVGYLLSKLKGKKVIYDVHEDVPRQILSKYWIPKVLRVSISKMVELLENYVSKRYSSVITATPYINQRFIRLNKSAVNINNYPIKGELYSASDHKDGKDKSVCYVGGITAARGIFEMVTSLEKLDVNLLLCGRFSSEKDYELVQKLSGWAKVNEMGFLNREQVADICSRSIAGIVVFHPEPNHINAQPNKLFEYMSAGLPVIAADFPLWREIVENNHCGICVNPLNPDAIESAIRFLLDNPVEARKMGDNGKRAIDEKYNWNKESEKLLQVYEQIN